VLPDCALLLLPCTQGQPASGAAQTGRAAP